MKKATLFLALLVTLSLIVNAQNQSRSMYVDQFHLILGNETAENELLAFSQELNITYLSLYDIHRVLDNFDALHTFIGKAKNQYGIEEVGACGENLWFFNHVKTYNQNYTNKFDVLNLELEYWNETTYPERPFDEFMTVLEGMKSIAMDLEIKTEAYVGWPTETEAQQMAPFIDRLLLHSYVQNPATAYEYAKERLSYFANPESPLTIRPLFSAEPDFMGNWLSENPINEAEEIYMQNFHDDAPTWQEGVSMDGFHYFTYSFMRQFVSHINESEQTSYNSLILYPNPCKERIVVESTNHDFSNHIIQLYNSLGVLLDSFDIHESREICTKNLSSGVYFLVSENGLWREKFVVGK
jgi:hypothetical protein